MLQSWQNLPEAPEAGSKGLRFGGPGTSHITLKVRQIHEERGGRGGVDHCLTKYQTPGLDSQVVAAQLAAAGLAAQQQRLVEAVLACQSTHGTGKVSQPSVESSGQPRPLVRSSSVA